MMSPRELFGGLGIALVLLLSSVQFVSLSAEEVGLQDQEFCSTQHKDESSCMKDREHNCVWCVAKAVPSGCYDADLAKRLPHSVFTCDSAEVDIETE